MNRYVIGADVLGTLGPRGRNRKGGQHVVGIEVSGPPLWKHLLTFAVGSIAIAVGVGFVGSKLEKVLSK